MMRNDLSCFIETTKPKPPPERKKILIGNYELKPLPDNIKQPMEFDKHAASIYG